MNKQIALRCLSILSFVGIWWAGSLLSPPEILPGPVAVGKTIVSNFTTAGPEDKTAEFHIAITLARILFTFSIAMGVRKNDKALHDEIDSVLHRKRAEIDAILEEYGVPRVADPPSQLAVNK